MPSAKRKLKTGDIVSIDTGVQLDGYFGDSAITVPVGEMNESVKRLLKVTEESRWSWRSTRCGRETGCSIFAGRWRSM